MAQTEDLSVKNAIAGEKDQDEKPNGGDGEHQLEHTSSPTVTTTVSLDIPPRVPAVAIGHQEAQTIDDILYKPYLSELQMPSIVQLMKASLSEPYSIYTYRYFIHKWPQLCKLAMYEGECVGAIVCKLEPHHFNIRRGYIAMLAVAKDFRRKKIGQFYSKLKFWCSLMIRAYKTDGVLVYRVKLVMTIFGGCHSSNECA